MSLIEKIKNIFNKKEQSTIETDKVQILPNIDKYEDMTMIAPHKSLYEDEDAFFYVQAHDKYGNPIVGETIELQIGTKHVEVVTQEDGIGKWTIDLPPKKYHMVKSKFPNGDYSQKLTSKIHVRRAAKKRKRLKPPEKYSERHCTIHAPNMTMYINAEGVYYVKLRDRFREPIEGEEVKITINNKTQAVITDKLGFAKINVKGLESGTYEVLSEFEGSSKYDPCKEKSELKMLVRDIDKEVIIDVQNLTMEFKVTKDKIDTLKEFLIRTLKRNKEKHEKIRVLDNISFKVYKGDKLGILGFNGAGKSTLLKIMTGIYEPTSGSITTYGKIAPLLELGAGFDKNYTGKNNIYLNGALLSIDEKTLNEKYDAIVEFSELGEFINYPIKNYSSGMRTKLGFSIATLINPDILIVDEILSVGDIKFRKKSAEKINSMMKDGVTVLLVTHSISQMKKICDKCIWLEDGHVKMYGESDEVCDAYVEGAKNDMKKIKK